MSNMPSCGDLPKRGRVGQRCPMSGSGIWRVLNVRHLASYRVFEVNELHSQRADTGHSQVFYRIDTVDWANVVPVTDDGNIVLVRQFRHGAGKETLEVPGGLVDPGETPLEAVTRELREETGYQAREVRLLGTVNPNPALFHNRQHCFVAVGCAPAGGIANDHDEHTEIELVPVAQIDRLLAEQAIDHALVMAAFHWWRLRGSPVA